MAAEEPPDWDNDSLSKYFKDAEYNERVTAINYPDVYELLGFVQGTFELAEQAIENARGHARPLPQILLVRAHSAFLASVRLAMSGQTIEARVVLRSGIESAWYALHVATDPAPGTRAEIWLRRNENEQATARCRREFMAAKVRASHEAVDPQGAADVQWLYETLIDFGAHPNQQGVLAAVIRSEDEVQIDYQVGILQPEQLRIMMTLRLAVATAVGVLQVFRAVFAERFSLSGVAARLDQLVAALNSVFARFARPTA